jgi:DNA-binding NarL/FixJ family response regulator
VRWNCITTARFASVLMMRGPETVVVVGGWNALPGAQESVQVGSIRVERCPAQARSITELVGRRHPTWLVMGDGPDESILPSLVQAGLQLFATLRLAMLGPPADWKRCERWLRRGCAVYLSNASDLERCLCALTLSRAQQLVVVDQIFQELAAAEARRIELGESLTSREEQVLTLLCLGLRNSRIASDLHISEPTVEFHIRHIFEKLGAETRVEAVNRAVALGLEPRMPLTSSTGEVSSEGNQPLLPHATPEHPLEQRQT